MTTLGNSFKVAGTIEASQATKAGEVVVLGEGNVIPSTFIGSSSGIVRIQSNTIHMSTRRASRNAPSTLSPISHAMYVPSTEGSALIPRTGLTPFGTVLAVYGSVTKEPTGTTSSTSLAEYKIPDGRSDIVQDLVDAFGVTTDLPEGSEIVLMAYVGSSTRIYNARIAIYCTVSAEGSLQVTEWQGPNDNYDLLVSNATAYLHYSELSVLSIGSGGGEHDFLSSSLCQEVPA